MIKVRKEENTNERTFITEEYVALNEASEKSGCDKKKIQALAGKKKISCIPCGESFKFFGKKQKLYNVIDIIQYIAAHPQQSKLKSVWGEITYIKKEFFKPIFCYDHKYFLSSNNRVADVTIGEILPQKIDSNGNTTVELLKYGEKVDVSIEKLIFLANIRPSESKYSQVWGKIDYIDNEKFYPIFGYNCKYFVTNTPRVINASNGEVLRQQVDKGGYHRVSLMKDSKAKGMLVHRLVFYTQCDRLPYQYCHHINTSKPSDDRPENLLGVYEEEHKKLHNLISRKLDYFYNLEIVGLRERNKEETFRIPHPDKESLLKHLKEANPSIKFEPLSTLEERYDFVYYVPRNTYRTYMNLGYIPKTGQYGRFMEALEPKSNISEANINHFKENYCLKKDLNDFLDYHLRNDTDESKITMFPLQCGIGKSEYIPKKISDALKNGEGMIIVTDETKRLKSYVSNVRDKDLGAYISSNMDKIAVLTAENFADEIKTLSSKPIVLMTTQRYFNLTKTEIIGFTSGQQKRKKIIFDEKAYLLESRVITIKTLNDIDTALKEALDNNVDPEKKKFMIEHFTEINKLLQEKLAENEKLNIDKNSFNREASFDAGKRRLDDKFVEYAEEYRVLLRKKNPDIIKDIRAIRKLFLGGTVVSQKITSNLERDKYNNYFAVVYNNCDKLVNIGAKVFVLDGTADISPESKLKCVDLVDCNGFRKDLSKLTINIVNLNTSKSKLTNNSESTKDFVNEIIKYIKSQTPGIDTVFTYQAIEDKFKEHFKNVEHFGNIKGGNQYRDVNNICQVGMNRWPGLVYSLYASEIDQYNHDYCWTNTICYSMEISELIANLLLADMEQNMFRSKIRNRDNSEKCVFTLIYSPIEKGFFGSVYSPLLKAIVNRYEMLGTKMYFTEDPTEFKELKAMSRKTTKETAAQKFYKWINSQPLETRFKRQDIMEKCEITKAQFTHLRRNGVFNEYKTDRQGVYVKR